MTAPTRPVRRGRADDSSPLSGRRDQRRGPGPGYRPGMAVDLFAGVPVSDYEAARRWYEQLFGSAPSFLPNDTEAVWEVAEHRYVYIVVGAEHAGHAMLTLFVGDLDALLNEVSARGLEPAAMETYPNGVRKATFRDPDGNEIGYGGAS